LYKIFYTLTVGSATIERHFSRLKLLKTYLRSTMNEDRLSSLVILSIESNIAQTIDFDKVISTFPLMRKRRQLLLCSYFLTTYMYFDKNTNYINAKFLCIGLELFRTNIPRSNIYYEIESGH